MRPGDVISGRYRLRERLGAGGMSVVWRANDDVLGREVAVKVLRPDASADPGLPHRIRDEARIAAGLRHANVVQVYDYGETVDAGRAVSYVVMELVDGRTLHDLLSGGALPWRLAVLVCAQVAAALAAAHARGVVHCDVKPGNVMVSGNGVKLVDFGISAAVGAVHAGELLGTPAYLAPERLAGGPVRPATDVYALGLLLYLGLAGRLPWQASTTTQMLKAHLYAEPAPLPAVPGLPAEVASLVRRCLDKQPAKRPAASEVAAVLGGIGGLPPESLLRDAAATTVPIEPLRRRRTLLAVAAVAVLAGTGIVGQVVSGGAKTPAAQAAEAPSCTVRYSLTQAAAGRVAAAVGVHNTGTAQLAAWRLTFTLPGGQRMVRGWSGRWEQRGSDVSAEGGMLPAGGSVQTGFDASYRQAAALPDSFALNGTPCRAELAVQGISAVTAPPGTRPATAPTRPATTPTRPAGAKPQPKSASTAVSTPRDKPKSKKAKSDEDKGKDDDKDDEEDDDED